LGPAAALQAAVRPPAATRRRRPRRAAAGELVWTAAGESAWKAAATAPEEAVRPPPGRCRRSWAPACSLRPSPEEETAGIPWAERDRRAGRRRSARPCRRGRRHPGAAP